MTFGAEMLALTRQTLEDPRAGVRSLLALGIPMPARTAGLLLVAVMSSVFLHLGFMLLPPSDDPLVQFMSASPLRTAAIQWVILAASVLLIYRIGRAMGGRGSLADTLLVIVWFQLIMLGVQALQLLALVLSPIVAAGLDILALGLFLWLLASFVAELHGFASRGAVLAGIFLAGFGLALTMVMILILIFGPEAFTRV